MGVADLCAGGPSIIILIHNICMAFNGLGRFNRVDTATSVSAAILLYCLSVTMATGDVMYSRAQLKSEEISDIVEY